MRAIAVTAAGRLAVVEDLEPPQPAAGHVLISMRAGGICGSDLTALDGALGTRGRTRVIGHEGGGTVVAVGARVTTHQPGDIVVVEPNYPCLTCEWCELGVTRMCRHRVVVGRDVPGLFAEQVVVPARHAWRVPAGTDPAVLASFEPAVVARTAVHAINVDDLTTALVVGAGSQGQAVVGALLDYGIKPAVAEPHPGRLRRALEQGARDAGDDPDEVFTVVFETSGAGLGLASSLERAALRGRVCLIGQSQAPVPVPTRPVVQKELTLRGSLIYDYPADFGSAVGALGAGTFAPAVALRPPVGPHQAVTDLQRARELDGKIWIDFSDWSR